MTSSLVPVQRIRLELDRMIRERCFFARVIGGRIEETPYRDLLFQLSGLIDAFADEQAPRYVPPRSRLFPREVCAPAALFRATALHYGEVLTPAVTTEIGVAILSTSWIVDAARRLSSRSSFDTSYLEALRAGGRESYRNLHERFIANAVDIEHAYGFAELVRGAFLGVAAYLDSAWPAPMVRVQVI